MTPDKARILAADRPRTLRMAGGSYVRNRDKELEGINKFLAALRSSSTFNRLFNQFNLEGVQRSAYEGGEEEVTQFRLTCAFVPPGNPGSQP